MISRLIERPSVTVYPIDLPTAKILGRICADSGHSDIVDAHVAMLALIYQTAVLTSDPSDMARLGIPAKAIIRI